MEVHLYKLQSCGIFRLNQLPPVGSSNMTLSKFIDEKLFFQNISVDELSSIIQVANENKEVNVIPSRERLVETPCTLIPKAWDEVTIYTDGGFIRNSNCASFGLTIEDKTVGRNDTYSTLTECSRIPGKQDNYRAELYGILRALKQCHNHQKVTIKSDSKSSIDAINKYNFGSVETRLKYGNRGLLDCIRSECKRVKHYKLEHVYGHSNVDGNEAADKLATQALSHNAINIHVHVAEYIKYSINNNGDELCKSPRDFIKEVITYNYVSKADYKYNLLHNEYHPISQKLWCKPDMQNFLTKARSNQLATNSKMNYWGNGKSSNTCTRCDDNMIENQLHVFCECNSNKPIFKRTFKIIAEIMNTSEFHDGITKPYHIPGLPFSVYNHYHLNHKYDPQHGHINTSYRWMMGLVTVQDIDDISKAGYTKPVKLASRILDKISVMAKEIWLIRNVQRIEVKCIK